MVDVSRICGDISFVSDFRVRGGRGGMRFDPSWFVDKRESFNESFEKGVNVGEVIFLVGRNGACPFCCVARCDRWRGRERGFRWVVYDVVDVVVVFGGGKLFVLGCWDVGCVVAVRRNA